MKCPHCGHWNRASFPRCFRCGMVLPQEQEAPPAQTSSPEPSGKTYIQINEEGRATAPRDERDELAREMKEYAARKNKGEETQQQLRQEGLEQGFAPTGRGVQTNRPAATIHYTGQNASFSADDAPVEGEIRPDAIPVYSSIAEELKQGHDRPRRVSDMTVRQMKVRHRFGMRRFTRIIILVFVIAAAFILGMTGYEYLAKKNAVPPLQDMVTITSSILNDLPAHLIKVPGEEGQKIWFKELKRYEPVAGGYASVEVPDHRWYEDRENITEESVTATLTLYKQTSAGEQKPMGTISYEVDIPISSLEVLSPSTHSQEVSTQMYPIEIAVTAGSTVTIGNENLSDLVNTNQGVITYQAQVAPTGNNEFVITARAPYCRERTITVTLYRAPQQIPLNLASDTGNSWRPGWVDDKTKPADENGKYPQEEQKMTIKGNTVSWANIRVLSDHRNLDLSNLAKDGSFSFEAIFSQIGENTIIIEAYAPGYETSTVRHNVYYVPVADIYSRKAWDMDQNYTDYLNNMERRVANTQIYQCRGEIIDIKSEKPQLAVMRLDSNYDRTVLLRNHTNDTWKVGDQYKIFADAFSSYDGAPWLNARYSYLQTK